ncbi:MAG: iron-sulfur cluster assembly scaffold protein [Bryobacteraceae bacterium]
MHSERLLDHFQNPRNAGVLTPPAVQVTVENPACGDILQLSALFADGVVKEVRFKVRGCTAAIAAGSALTELMLGRRSEDLRRITREDVESTVGGLIPESKHAAVLAIDGVRRLLTVARDAGETAG